MKPTMLKNQKVNSNRKLRSFLVVLAYKILVDGLNLTSTCQVPPLILLYESSSHIAEIPGQKKREKESSGREQNLSCMMAA